jgi:predicted PurR-regulated permease PerM
VVDRDSTTRDWSAIQTRLTVSLLALAVLLGLVAVFQVILSLATRFSQTILMFVIGAIVAYLLIPTVNALQRVVRQRWLAILLVYVLVFATFLALGTILFSPFVHQARSLAANLQKPSPASLQGVLAVKASASQVATDLTFQQGLVDSGLAPAPADVQKVRTEITALRNNTTSLQQSSAAHVPVANQPLHGGTQAPVARTRIPPSYVAPMLTDVAKIDRFYAQTTSIPGRFDHAAITRAVTAATATRNAANTAYSNAASTSLLLLDLQAWLDDHSIKVDIHQGFGQVTRQLSNQTASIVNNSISIVLAAGTLFVNGILVLIISIYFLSDGPRLVRAARNIGPPPFRQHIPFYLASLDRSLAGYIRGQVLLASAAAILGAGGALVLGVPYAVLIGLSTFFLSLVPVIGPIILIIPPVVIALVFSPLTTAIILTVYFLVMMQLITNVVGPRVMGSAVGIHPLEAMAAALIGLPLAGVLGAFFAVPIVGFLHVALRHAYREFFVNRSTTDTTSIGTVPAAALPALEPVHGDVSAGHGEQESSV